MNELTNKVKIVGIAGLPRSGKDSLAKVFMDNGYFGVSLGEIFRDAAMVRHANDQNPISVANMTETSNWLRQTKGADFALKEALSKYEASIKDGASYEGLVVWSIRAPVEVDFILQKGGQLIWIETNDDLRLQRAKRDKRPGEPDWTKDEFKKQEALQWVPQPGIAREAQMDIAYVKNKSTSVLVNDTDDIGIFEQSAKKLLH